MVRGRVPPSSLFRLTAIVLFGLGFGIASKHFWLAKVTPQSASPSVDLAGSSAFAASDGIADDEPAGHERSKPTVKTNNAQRALLVGVTKYDNLDPSVHLSGPANDVGLLRTTLIDRYGFPPENVVCLTEVEEKAELRPTHANIALEFKRLAEAVRAGDQVVVLLAGHGDREPESIPPDPISPEPDGIDEIFLPADVEPWRGFPERVRNAIVDNELRDWLAAITAKQAYVWALFDCCHSGSMTRGTEVVRQLPAGVLVPREELAKAREKVSERTSRPLPDQSVKEPSFVAADDFLVASFACREFELAPECPQPGNSRNDKHYGLFTYSVVSCLEQCAASDYPLTYRELMQRVQASYLSRPHGSPTPMIVGVGQDRIVLGGQQPVRPKIVITRIKGKSVVNVGDLHGVTPGSILRVYSPAGGHPEPEAIGYVRVDETQPLQSTVVAVAYDDLVKRADLPPNGLCEVAAIQYPVARRLCLAVDADDGADTIRRIVARAIDALPAEEAALFTLVEDVSSAHFVVHRGPQRPELQDASGSRQAIPLPAVDSKRFAAVLTATIKAIQRANSLISIGTKLEGSRDSTGSDVKIEVISHSSDGDGGEPIERPASGWVFRPGDRISFRVTNTSKTKRLEVTLLIVDPDYQITVFHPGPGETNKAVEPGASFNTGVGTINDEPPFGPETLVAIVTSPTNPPVDYSLLTQPGVWGENSRGAPQSCPIAQLLDRALNGMGTRTGLRRAEIQDQGARVLTWRTVPAANGK